MSPLSSPRLSEEDRRTLLYQARYAITEVVRSRVLADTPRPIGRLAEPGGAFVTVHCAGRLRGCVGRTDRTLALAEVVTLCAIGAAVHDTRFRPLIPAELEDLEIEISVLSDLQSIAPNAIEIGLHGLVVSNAGHRGLLLPQVASERNWSAEQFLAETCRKAGLDPDAWQDKETLVLAFTAEVFSEQDLFSDSLEGR